MQESFPDARRLIEAGEMIPDTLVGDLLLEALLLDEPGLQDDLGFVVDGFPRTACQVRHEVGSVGDAAVSYCYVMHDTVLCCPRLQAFNTCFLDGVYRCQLCCCVSLHYTPYAGSVSAFLIYFEVLGLLHVCSMSVACPAG
jgi:hypothetical protein